MQSNDLLNITITSYICGGTDADTIANVKELVGMNSRSLVLASEDNFKMFLKRMSQIILCLKSKRTMEMTAFQIPYSFIRY